MLNANEIGMRIKEQQQKLGMKQKDIIEKSGISKAAISNYISGLRVPDTEALYKISLALETSMEYLLIGKSTNENYTEEERQLLEAYRNAELDMKKAARKILDAPELPGKLSISEDGKKII